MSTHTPGPWERCRHAKGRLMDVATKRPFSGNEIPVRIASDIEKANARLIAAAPDLLTACEAANDWFSPGNDSYERKAEECYRETGFMRPGKDQPAAASHSYDERSAAWNEWCAKRSAKVLADLRAAIAAARGGK